MVIRMHLVNNIFLNVANAYVPAQEYSMIPKLSRLLARLQSTRYCCDFNTRYRLLDSITLQNTDGRNLMKVLQDNSDKLIHLNPDEIPTQLTSRESLHGTRESRTVTPQVWELLKYGNRRRGHSYQARFYCMRRKGRSGSASPSTL